MKTNTVYIADSFRTIEIKNAKNVYFFEGNYQITTTKNTK